MLRFAFFCEYFYTFASQICNGDETRAIDPTFFFRGRR